MERKVYLEPKEVERLEQAAGYVRDRLLIRLLFRLGCPLLGLAFVFQRHPWLG